MRADRLLSLLLLLQAHGRMSATSLAAKLEVSRRTVFRDLDALSGAGVPVATERGPRGGAFLLDGYRTDLTGLTEQELEALLAFGGAGPASDLGLGRELDQASRKLAAARPKSAGRLAERVLIDGSTWIRGAYVPSHLSRVQDALWSNRRLRLQYRRDVDRVVERVVEPLGLVCKAGTWYLMARIDDSVRTYRVSRIEGAELTDETFVRPADFNLRASWDSSVKRFRETAAPPRVSVRVRVDPSVSAQFNRIIGEQIVSRSGDGVVVLDFAACEAAVSPLAAFGSRVEVLEPQDLRDRLAHLGEELSELYRSPS